MIRAEHPVDALLIEAQKEYDLIGKDTASSSLVLTELYAPIARHLDKVKRAIEDELFSDHPFVNDLCSHVSTYRGKMLRPALLLLSGEAVGEVTPQHHTLAAVVELVHLATLVHDDVLDNASMRRQRSTINADHGNEAAVLLGDYLISHAYHLCSGLDDQFASRLIGATTNTVCEGELAEIHHRHDANVSESTYLSIIRSKTASLTGACCALGARSSGASQNTINSLQEFGLACGMAFQIVDDILDLVGDEQSTGKSLGLDLAHGSATLPGIHCLEHAEPAVAASLSSFVHGETRADIADIRTWLQSTGSVEYAMGIAREFVSRALQHISQLPDSPSKDSLGAMCEFILRRQF